MKIDNKRSQSRRRTPWDTLKEEERTPLQSFLRNIYRERFDYHHQSLDKMNDSALFDSYSPTRCPYCGSTHFIKYGRYQTTNLQKYKCAGCRKSFCITTGTIFEDHKISIGEWLQYLLNLFDYVSLNAGSKNNKNAFTTSRYWLQKVFLVLQHYQDETLLSGRVYLDETYIKVRAPEVKKKENGKEYRGISRNQICIASAADKRQVFCKVAGNAKPTSEGILSIFKDHIRKRSTVVHDGEAAHVRLIEELNLKDEVYCSNQLNNLPDEDNPLDRINTIHALLKWFLEAHSGFLRKYTGDFLNLFAFIMNPPHDKLKKAELFLDMAIRTRISLRYRDFYKSEKGSEENLEA